MLLQHGRTGHRDMVAFEDCGYCGEDLLPPTPRVFWHFVDYAVWMHPRCAHRLGMHLMRDAYLDLGGVE